LTLNLKLLFFSVICYQEFSIKVIKVICNARNVVHKLESEASSNHEYNVVIVVNIGTILFLRIYLLCKCCKI